MILVNGLADPKQKIKASLFIERHGDSIRDKHIIYVIKPRCLCDALNFKIGKSHNGYQRIKSYSIMYCTDVDIYYIETFNKRHNDAYGKQPVDFFETNLIRTLKQMKVQFVRGGEFVRCGSRKMLEAIKMTHDGGEPASHPLRQTTRKLPERLPWFQRGSVH